MAGYIEMPGGWCVPNDQAIAPISTWPGYDDHADDDEPEEEDSGPPRFQRGGIKYPKTEAAITERAALQKGTTMTLTPQQAVRRLEAELDKNLDLQHVLKLRSEELRAELKKAHIPAEPDAARYGDTFAVDVKFSSSGKVYRFLLLRTPGGWFTTGTSAETKRFGDWPALAVWLRGPDVFWHSTIVALVQGPVAVDGSDA